MCCDHPGIHLLDRGAFARSSQLYLNDSHLQVCHTLMLKMRDAGGSLVFVSLTCSFWQGVSPRCTSALFVQVDISCLLNVHMVFVAFVAGMPVTQNCFATHAPFEIALQHMPPLGAGPFRLNNLFAAFSTN